MLTGDKVQILIAEIDIWVYQTGRKWPGPLGSCEGAEPFDGTPSTPQLNQLWTAIHTDEHICSSFGKVDAVCPSWIEFLL